MNHRFHGCSQISLYNPKQLKQRFIPASTFKICSSLIGLETGVIADENFVLKWDGVKSELEEWSQDQDLKTAYKNSTVPYYQELAWRFAHYS
ncbi:MAG: penicillin-binding transpeptidase domain-containing protein [Bacteroidota bacterium]